MNKTSVSVSLSVCLSVSLGLSFDKSNGWTDVTKPCWDLLGQVVNRPQRSPVRHFLLPFPLDSVTFVRNPPQRQPPPGTLLLIVTTVALLSAHSAYSLPAEHSRKHVHVHIIQKTLLCVLLERFLCRHDSRNTGYITSMIIHHFLDSPPVAPLDALHTPSSP